jgi:hypothetical protein
VSVYFGVKVADFFEQLWCCCNTLTILKESLTAERIAWFATQRIQRIGGVFFMNHFQDVGLYRFFTQLGRVSR